MRSLSHSLSHSAICVHSLALPSLPSILLYPTLLSWPFSLSFLYFFYRSRSLSSIRRAVFFLSISHILYVCLRVSVFFVCCCCCLLSCFFRICVFIRRSCFCFVRAARCCFYLNAILPLVTQYSCAVCFPSLPLRSLPIRTVFYLYVISPEQSSHFSARCNH